MAAAGPNFHHKPLKSAPAPRIDKIAVGHHRACSRL
jgi:hypothetical protein